MPDYSQDQDDRGAQLVPDELWSLIQPVLPLEPPKPRGGRPRVPDRQALCGILYVLSAEIAWEDLPQRLGFGSGMTCWRRLRDWERADVWDKVKHICMANRQLNMDINWRRSSIVNQANTNGRTKIGNLIGGRLPTLIGGAALMPKPIRTFQYAG